MFRLKSILSAVAAIICVLVVSQQVSANDDFRKWLQQEKSSFQEYKDKRDREFTAFLKTQWKEMELLRGFKRDETPKPMEPPMAKPQPVKPPQPVVQPAPAPEPVPETRPVPEQVTRPPLVAPPGPVVKPVVPPAPVAMPKGKKISMSYYGSRLVFYYDPKLKARLSGRIDKNAVSDFWSALSLGDYDDLISQIDTSAKALELNDWAYAVLVHDISEKIYPAADNSQSLFTWFMLAKAGYRARIAYDDHTVYLLVPSRQQLYSVPYFTFDKVRYYAIRFDGKDQTLGQVYTYDGNYPGADRALDMQLLSDMVPETGKVSRVLTFEFEGRQYSINATYENERIDLLNTYPQLDLEWYFRSKVSSSTSTPLQKQLGQYIKDMDEQQAVNFLLRFVQTALKYKTDEGQFGKENYLFPEETLHYPYSDCEDRSVLFAWLVQSLLGLDVIGLDFPGHVATAVHFNGEVSGDAISYQGRRYLVADPTYINATAGMTMPDYKNTRPNVIRIK